jgi:hypothetical protein
MRENLNILSDPIINLNNLYKIKNIDHSQIDSLRDKINNAIMDLHIKAVKKSNLEIQKSINELKCKLKESVSESTYAKLTVFMHNSNTTSTKKVNTLFDSKLALARQLKIFDMENLSRFKNIVNELNTVQNQYENENLKEEIKNEFIKNLTEIDPAQNTRKLNTGIPSNFSTNQSNYTLNPSSEIMNVSGQNFIDQLNASSTPPNNNIETLLKSLIFSVNQLQNQNNIIKLPQNTSKEKKSTQNTILVNQKIPPNLPLLNKENNQKIIPNIPDSMILESIFKDNKNEFSQLIPENNENNKKRVLEDIDKNQNKDNNKKFKKIETVMTRRK